MLKPKAHIASLSRSKLKAALAMICFFLMLAIAILIGHPSPAIAGWENLGLYGGQIYEIAIDPGSPSKMFAGSYYGDGLFVTTDGGSTWSPVLTGHEGEELDGDATFRNTAVWAVKIAPSNSNIIWVAHNYCLEKSTDGGTTWTHISNSTIQLDCTNSGGEDDDLRYCESLVIHPTDPQTVYVGTGGPDGSDSKGAIYKTDDGGNTWTKLGIDGLFDAGGYAINLDHEFYSTVGDIAFHPTDSEIIWALDFNDVLGEYRGFLYLSTDGGKTWNWDIGIPAYIAEQGLAVKPTAPYNEVFIGSWGGSDFGGIIKVTYDYDEESETVDWDASITWSSPLPYGSHVRALAFDPQNDNILYADGGSTGAFKLLKSLDGGETFLEYPHDQQFISLSVHPTNSDIIYGGDRCLGIYEGELINDHPEPLEEIIIDNGDPGTSYTGDWVYVTTWGCGYYGDWNRHRQSVDETATYIFQSSLSGLYRVSMWWESHSAHPTAVPVEIYDGDDLLETVYVNQQMNGCQWNPIGDYQFNGTAKIVIVSEGPTYLSADAVKFSNDLTDYAWTPINEGVRAIRVNDIAVDPNDPNHDHYIVATMAGVYEKDGDSAWTAAANLRYTEAFSVEFDPSDTDGSTYYAGIESYLAKTDDNGSTWSLSNSLGYPHFVNSIAIDPNNTSTLYVTTRYPGAVYKSTDGGASLTSIMSFAAVLDTGPSNATSFSLNSNGSFTYVHDGSETTTDSFIYHVNDGITNSNTATVTINITPSSSTSMAVDDTYSVEKGGTIMRMRC